MQLPNKIKRKLLCHSSRYKNKAQEERYIFYPLSVPQKRSAIQMNS